MAALSQNSSIILITNFEKGYDSHEPEFVDNNQIVYTYNLLKKKGGGARRKYKEILDFAYTNKLSIEFYYRNGWGSYTKYGTGIISYKYPNNELDDYILASYELNLHCQKLLKIQKYKNSNEKKEAFPYVKGCLLNSNYNKTARQWPGIYVKY